jgi:hypothetical protein
LKFYSSSGKVSIVAACNWFEPKTDSKEEEEAAERARQIHVRSCWMMGFVCHMKGTCIGDFQSSSFRGIFIINYEEINGGWRMVVYSGGS